MDQVGELVIAQSRLKQIAAASRDIQVKTISEEIERLALELRDTTMGARLVPIGQLFGRFRRLVHDLSHELAKEVSLVPSGEETELDKTLIERLVDPLIHLIRNSVDHGIEPPAQREAVGKPRQGRITLSASHLGHEVLITISDDGAGLDRPASSNGQKSRACSCQVPSRPTASCSSSFCSRVSRPPMRLPACPAVASAWMWCAARSMRCAATSTSPARQARAPITLRLPLTLAIIDGLLVRVGAGRYVIPLSAIEECVELSEADDTRSRGHTFLNIRGSLVPFMRLREVFATRTPPDPTRRW